MKRKSKFLVSITAFLLFSACNKKSETIEAKREPAPAESTNAHPPTAATMPFLDQWSKSATLTEFKTKLIADLGSGNQPLILAAFSEEFEINPGTSKGQQGVIETWGLDGTKEKLQPLKAILDSLLNDGGCLVPGGSDPLLKDDSAFRAPSHNCIPSSEIDKCGDLGCAVAGKSGSELFRLPDANSQAVAKMVPFEIASKVQDTVCNEAHTICDWVEVARANGDQGYTPAHSVKTKMNGYLKLWKEPTGWKIMVLRFPGILTEE